MNIDKDLQNSALSDDELNDVSGGTRADHLVFTGKVPASKKTIQKGKKSVQKAGDLVWRGDGQTQDAKSSFDGMEFSGDIGKGTYC